MLQRSTQVGEFYRMTPPKTWTGIKLPSSYMDIVIYDEEQDKHVHITIKEALRAAMPNEDMNGPSKTPAGGFFGLGEDTDDQDEKDKVKEKVAAKAREANPDQAAFDAVDMTTERTADELAAEIAKGRYFVGEVIIVRPFIEHLMMSAIMTVSGRDTGATLFGPAGEHPFHAFILVPCTYTRTHVTGLHASALPLALDHGLQDKDLRRALHFWGNWSSKVVDFGRGIQAHFAFAQFPVEKGYFPS